MLAMWLVGSWEPFSVPVAWCVSVACLLHALEGRSVVGMAAHRSPSVFLLPYYTAWF